MHVAERGPRGCRPLLPRPQVGGAARAVRGGEGTVGNSRLALMATTYEDEDDFIIEHQQRQHEQHVIDGIYQQLSPSKLFRQLKYINWLDQKQKLSNFIEDPADYLKQLKKVLLYIKIYIIIYVRN